MTKDADPKMKTNKKVKADNKASHQGVKMFVAVGITGLVLGAGGFYLGNAQGQQSGSASGFNKAKARYSAEYATKLSSKESQLNVVKTKLSKAQRSDSSTKAMVSNVVNTGYTAKVNNNKSAKYQSLKIIPLANDRYNKGASVIGVGNKDTLIDLRVTDNSNHKVTLQMVSDPSVKYQFNLPK